VGSWGLIKGVALVKSLRTEIYAEGASKADRAFECKECRVLDNRKQNAFHAAPTYVDKRQRQHEHNYTFLCGPPNEVILLIICNLGKLGRSQRSGQGWW